MGSEIEAIKNQCAPTWNWLGMAVNRLMANGQPQGL
jgi:hypothetical protein